MFTHHHFQSFSTKTPLTKHHMHITGVLRLGVSQPDYCCCRVANSGRGTDRGDFCWSRDLGEFFCVRARVLTVTRLCRCSGTVDKGVEHEEGHCIRRVPAVMANWKCGWFS